MAQILFVMTGVDHWTLADGRSPFAGYRVAAFTNAEERPDSPTTPPGSSRTASSP
ncbi:hypothetical protein [Nocardia sp. NPDC004711]